MPDQAQAPTTAETTSQPSIAARLKDVVKLVSSLKPTDDGGADIVRQIHDTLLDIMLDSASRANEFAAQTAAALAAQRQQADLASQALRAQTDQAMIGATAGVSGNPSPQKAGGS